MQIRKHTLAHTHIHMHTRASALTYIHYNFSLYCNNLKRNMDISLLR